MSLFAEFTADGYWIHDFSPFLIDFGGGWGIRYYGLAYVVGFLAFYFGMLRFYEWQWSPLNADQVADLLMWMVVGVLAGGRLGYCLFYDLENTLNDPLHVIAFWRYGGISGMASHGGFLGVLLAGILFARRTGVSFWQLADNICTLVPVGLFLGRIANFINGELWGRVTDVPWAVIFKVPGELSTPRHPSQLYEAFGEGLVAFAVVFLVRLKFGRLLKAGDAALLFLVLYSIARISAEFFREPDSHIGFDWLGLTRGQWLSFGLIILAMILWWVRRKWFLPRSDEEKAST